jgi:Ca2+-binding RTX toxin-like protein
MKSEIFSYIFSILLLSLGVIGTTILGSSINQAWADVFEGTEGPDRIVGTPGDDIIDSKGGNDQNFGDTVFGDGSGDDNIISEDAGDVNYGDTVRGEGSGNDNIISGEGNDRNTGNGGRDIFVCGEGEDTVTDFNEAEGDIATPDCENI